MDNRVYWIWLQNAFGAGSPKPVQLVRRIGSAEKLYQGGTRLWSSFSFVSDKELAALNAYGAEQAAAALEYYLKLGQKVITPDDEDYPLLLKEIYKPVKTGSMPQERSPTGLRSKTPLLSAAARSALIPRHTRVH